MRLLFKGEILEQQIGARINKQLIQLLFGMIVDKIVEYSTLLIKQILKEYNNNNNQYRKYLTSRVQTVSLFNNVNENVNIKIKQLVEFNFKEP